MLTVNPRAPVLTNGPEDTTKWMQNLKKSASLLTPSKLSTLFQVFWMVDSSCIQHVDQDQNRHEDHADAIGAAVAATFTTIFVDFNAYRGTQKKEKA